MRKSLASNPNEIVEHVHILPKVAKVARKARVIPLPEAQLVLEPVDTADQDVRDFNEVVLRNGFFVD